MNYKTGEKFLQRISKKIDKSDISLVELSGFDLPNNFKINYVTRLIEDSKFPNAEDITEVCWGIYESGIEELEKLPLYVRVYISIMCLYGHRKTSSIDSLDEIYFYSLAKASKNLTESDKKELIEFLYWFEKYVPYADEFPPNSDFFLLMLIWVLELQLQQCISAIATSDLSDRYLQATKYHILGSVYDDYPERWSGLIEELDCTEQYLEILNIFTTC